MKPVRNFFVSYVRTLIGMPSAGSLWLATIAVVLVVLVGVLLQRKLLAPPTAPLQMAQLRFLHPGFADQRVDLAAVDGAHVVLTGTPERPVAYLANNLTELGSATVNLCDQRSRQVNRPDALVPVRLLSTAALEKASEPLRQPVIFDELVLPDMPLVRVEGSAGVNSAGAALRWRITTRGSEALLLGGVGVVHDIAAKGEAVVEHTGEQGALWLAWGAASGRPAMALAPVGDRSATAPATTHTFAHILRGRVVADFACAAGKIEFTVYGEEPEVTRASVQAGAGSTDDGKVESVCLAGTLGPEGQPAPVHCSLAARRSLLLTRFSAGEPMVRSMRLLPGRYVVPKTLPPLREDHELFEAAVQHGVIRLSERGLIDVSPADAHTTAELSGARLSSAEIAVLKQVHRWANGERVISAVDQWNAGRRTAAVQVAGSASIVERANNNYAWSVLADAMPLMVTRGLGDDLPRFVESVEPGAGEWLRVIRWPTGVAADTMDAAPVSFALATRPEDAGAMLRVNVIGRVLAVTGAEVIKTDAVCRARACLSPHDITRLTLRVAANAQTHTPAAAIEVQVAPSSSVVPRDGPRAGLPIAVSNGQLVWLDSKAALPGEHDAPARVFLAAADGSELYSEGAPTAAAKALGLAPLVGIAPSHGNSVAGVLARLPQDSVNAILTIEPRLQQAAVRALDCVGHRGGRIQGGECVAAGVAPAERRSAILLMDANSGAVLSAVAAPLLTADGSTRDFLAVDRYHPAASQLRWSPWMHDGGGRFSPGSAFKTVDALAAEGVARNAPTLDRVLAGRPLASAEWAQANGLAFSMAAACYPAPCSGSQAQVTNYQDHNPASYARADGKFGVEEALGYSLNTWFAMLVESTDAAGRRGYADMRPLNGTPLSLRPTIAMAERLGFGHSFRLDGGLLPASMLRPGDLLLASASRIDPLDDQGDIRRLALGLRMQATAMQMAVVAAAIGTGQVVEPTVLRNLDGRVPAVRRTPLGVRTDRVRAGMALAVRAGTARGAFARPELKGVQEYVWGKTGTAPHASDQHNNAWFIGGLEPGAIPGIDRPLAFAVMVSNTPTGGTGGARAATVVAELLAQLRAGPGA